MPLWLQIAFAVAAIVVPPLAAYFAAKRGIVRGMEIGMAVHGEQIKSLQNEVVFLRNSKHEHAQRLTQHEAYLAVIKRKLGID